jgi:hypothetical protein
MVSSAKMMLMNSSFQKTNVPEQLKLPYLKIKKTGSEIPHLWYDTPLFFITGSSTQSFVI